MKTTNSTKLALPTAVSQCSNGSVKTMVFWGENTVHCAQSLKYLQMTMVIMITSYRNSRTFQTL